MFNSDPNNQNRRPMDYETELDRRAARPTAHTTIPIVLASVFIVAIAIGLVVMSRPHTDTANNEGMALSLASRILHPGGTGTPVTSSPAPATSASPPPATTGSGTGR